MAMYPIKELFALWFQEKLTTEQAMGHVIQNLASYFTRLAQVEKRLAALEQQTPDPKA